MLGPDTQCDDSQLCAELRGETEGIAFHSLYRGNPTSRILTESKNFALIVDIAPLAPGHALLVPKDHYINFGLIPAELYEELDGFREQCVGLIASVYRRPTVLEHGSCSDMRNSPCISHAHWHLIPGAESAVRIFENDGLWGRDIESWHELRISARIDQPYVYYSFGSAQRLYDVNLSKRHQYLRIVIAEVLGIPEPEWDWALTLHPEILRETVSILR